MAADALPRFVARVLRGQRPVGVAFVVGNSHILTCAHVVNAALERDLRLQEAPADSYRVILDFPIVGEGEDFPTRRAKVVAWAPPPASG